MYLAPIYNCMKDPLNLSKPTGIRPWLWPCPLNPRSAAGLDARTRAHAHTRAREAAGARMAASKAVSHYPPFIIYSSRLPVSVLTRWVTARPLLYNRRRRSIGTVRSSDSTLLPVFVIQSIASAVTVDENNGERGCQYTKLHRLCIGILELQLLLYYAYTESHGVQCYSFTQFM